jgi:Holliday junction resolvase
MPNNAYIRGVAKERALVNEYRRKGWDACRSAGSHSSWDVWAYNPKTGEVVLTQIKSKKGKKRINDKVLSSFKAQVTTIWRSYY